MSSYKLMEDFLSNKDKVTDISKLVGHIQGKLPGFGMAINYPGTPSEAMGAVNMFVQPPAQHQSFRPVFVIAKDDKELIRKIFGAVPRLLRDIIESQSELEEENYEFVAPDRKGNTRRKPDIATRPTGRAQPAGRNQPRKAIREGRVQERHTA